MSGRIRMGDDELPVKAQEKPAEPPAPPPPAPPPPSEPVEAPELPPTREATPEPPPAPAEGAPEGEGEPSRQELSPELRKRLASLTQEKYEARRQAEELQQRLAQIERERQQAAAGGQVDPIEQAKEQLRQEAREREFNQACNDLYRRGQQEYADFDDAVKALNAVGFGNRPDALAAIAQLPDNHRVYRTLASDLDNAARVLSLPPMAMAVELARMAVAAPAGNGTQTPLPPAEPSPSPLVTRAPEPLRSIGGTSRSGPVPLEKTSMADFIRRRDQEERRSRISR